MTFQPGKSYHIHMPSGKRDIVKIHVLAIIDDYMIVYKYFGPTKQRWLYRIENHIGLQGALELAKKLKRKK